MPFSLLARTVAATGVFVGLWAVGSIAHFPNQCPLFFGLLGGALGALPALAGYGEATVVANLKLWIASLTAYALVLPFALYARAPHHWAVLRAPGKTTAGAQAVYGSPASALLLTSLLALGTLGYMGVGKGLVGILLVGAFATYRAHRRLPPIERRQLSNMAVAHGLALAFVAPAVVVGLWVDAGHYADAARPLPEALHSYVVSPDGRYVAACLQPDEGKGLSRVVVADLSGKEPLRVLPPRCADLDESCAWSKDGRYLAVHELALGRVGVAGALGSSFFPLHFGSEVQAIDELIGRHCEMLARSLQGTYVLDTQTGSLAWKDLLELAPGWTSPDELLHVAPHSLGGCDLEDGRRHSTLWDKPELKVDSYSPGAVVLVSETDRFVLGAGGLAPVASASTWQLVAKVERPEPGVDPAHGRKAWDLTFAKGERTRTVESCRSFAVIWVDDETVTLYDQGGRSLLDLDTGDRRVLTKRMKKGSSSKSPLWGSLDGRVRFLGERPYLIEKAPDGNSLLVDVKTAAATPLPSIPGFEPEVVVGPRIFGKLAGKGLAVSESGNAPKPVF